MTRTSPPSRCSFPASFEVTVTTRDLRVRLIVFGGGGGEEEAAAEDEWVVEAAVEAAGERTCPASSTCSSLQIRHPARLIELKMKIEITGAPVFRLGVSVLLVVCNGRPRVYGIKL